MVGKNPITRINTHIASHRLKYYKNQVMQDQFAKLPIFLECLPQITSSPFCFTRTISKDAGPKNQNKAIIAAIT